MVVETKCNFLSEITFPESIEAGLRVTKIGNSSVVYEIALFKETSDAPSAVGHFVHVYVDRESRKPSRIPDRIRAALILLSI